MTDTPNPITGAIDALLAARTQYRAEISRLTSAAAAIDMQLAEAYATLTQILNTPQPPEDNTPQPVPATPAPPKPQPSRESAEEDEGSDPPPELLDTLAAARLRARASDQWLTVKHIAATTSLSAGQVRAALRTALRGARVEERRSAARGRRGPAPMEYRLCIAPETPVPDSTPAPSDTPVAPLCRADRIAYALAFAGVATPAEVSRFLSISTYSARNTLDALVTAGEASMEANTYTLCTPPTPAAAPLPHTARQLLAHIRHHGRECTEVMLQNSYNCTATDVQRGVGRLLREGYVHADDAGHIQITRDDDNDNTAQREAA